MVRPTSDMDGNMVNILCLVLLPEEGSWVKLYSYRALTTAKVKFTTKRSSTSPVFVYYNFQLDKTVTLSKITYIPSYTPYLPDYKLTTGYILMSLLICINHADQTLLRNM